MDRKSTITLAAALTIGLSAGAWAQTGKGVDPWPPINWTQTQLSNNCEFGERLDGSTMADAKRRIEAVGLTGVRDLRKGCDNMWHAKANANGSEVNIAVSPDGQVLRETE